MPDALSWLRGSWTIERRLADHRSGSAGWFRGAACFEPPGPAEPGSPQLSAHPRLSSDNSKRLAAGLDACPSPRLDPHLHPHPPADNSKKPAAGLGRAEELLYHEKGELAFGEHRGPASRSLIYRDRGDGTADVFFADGREFYWLDPRPGRWQARHKCGRDEYLVSGRVLGAGMFEERWLVTGPAKDYEIMTTLTRVDSE